MAEKTHLYKGTVVPMPFFSYTKSGKPMLKFKARLKDDPNKLISVVVWGDQAEKASDLQPHEEIVVSGKWKENEFNGQTTNELHLGDYGGNLKRTGAPKAPKIHSHGESAPQRSKSVEAIVDRYFSASYLPDIEDPPDGFDCDSAPTDGEFDEFCDLTWTRYALMVGETCDPGDAQQTLW